MQNQQVAKRVRVLTLALAITVVTNYALSLTIDSVPGNPPPRPFVIESVPGNLPPRPVADAVPGNPPPRPMSESVLGTLPPHP